MTTRLHALMLVWIFLVEGFVLSNNIGVEFLSCSFFIPLHSPFLLQCTSTLGRIRDMHAQIINSIKDLQLDGEDPRKLLQSWGRLRFPRHALQ